MPAQHVTLPPERHQQLKALAADLDCSLSDAVGHLLNIAAHAGLISRQLPGLLVERVGKRVRVDVGGGKRLLPPLSAERLAKHVLGVAGLLPVDAAARYAAAMGGAHILPDSGLGAVRQGAGVRLLDNRADAHKKVLAPSVAQEFANQLLEASRETI